MNVPLFFFGGAAASADLPPVDLRATGRDGPATAFLAILDNDCFYEDEAGG